MFFSPLVFLLLFFLPLNLQWIKCNIFRIHAVLMKPWRKYFFSPGYGLVDCSESIPIGVLIISAFSILISDLLQNPVNKSRIFHGKFFCNYRHLIFCNTSSEFFYFQTVILWDFYRLFFIVSRLALFVCDTFILALLKPLSYSKVVEFNH